MHSAFVYNIVDISLGYCCCLLFAACVTLSSDYILLPIPIPFYVTMGIVECRIFPLCRSLLIFASFVYKNSEE